MDTPSAFDPQQFLDAQTTEAAVRRPPLPIENPASADGLYTGVLGEPKFRTWQGKSDATKSGMAVDIPIAVEVPAQLQEQFKLPPSITLMGGGFLDMTEAGSIDWAPGRNRSIRPYREATGLNAPGQPFAFRMFTGKVVKVKIKHEMFDGDPLDKIQNVLKA